MDNNRVKISLPLRMIITALALLLSFGVQAQAEQGNEADASAAADSNDELLTMQKLAPSFDSEELHWLGDGEQTFISLHRPAIEPSQMALILLANSPADMAKVNFLSEIYYGLPEFGWSTLLMPMPVQQEKTFTTRSAAETDGEAENEKDATLQTALMRLEKSIEFLVEKERRAVALVADNLNVSAAVEVATNEGDRASAMVLWRVETQQLDRAKLKALLDTRISILDIVDHSISEAEKKQRMRIFRLAGYSNDYRLITTPLGQPGIAHSVRRIRHWLETNFQKY